MTESGDQSSGFWTMTRPSKLSKRRNSDLHELHHKIFNISVVGLSGADKDKGPVGIGKSCLCNRFVRSAADDYYTDHISVLSQSDFGGHVVNHDHWLYWGSVVKSCDGYDLAFNIIEQTEFVDDACFQPFRSGTKAEPYFKRCANIKLTSPEKLMYICKNQLGVEREYDQRFLPDGKFTVDGFLCLFDVSEIQGRDIDKQIEVTNLILLNLMKTKKPIVFVTTKHDEASELLIQAAESLVNQRDFRGTIPIVETSARENVNINMAFLVCAQLIDKTRTKLRVPPYFEAYKNHVDLLNSASDAYIGLIRSTVLDYTCTWQQMCIKLSHNPEFLQYTYLHGLDKARAVFKTHLMRLREGSINQKVQGYLKLFPDVLDEIIFRQCNNNNTQSWDVVKNQLKSHSLFNKYFIEIPEGISWPETELLQSPETRIPSDWLDSEEAQAIFDQRNKILENEQKRQLSKEMFLQTLYDIKVSVGKPFVELKPLFENHSALSFLNDQELFDIYVEYQNNILQQARADFQELLLENAEHLHSLTSSNKVIRQEDIKTINAILQHDERYQALDQFDQDRTLMMIRHLSFLHSQLSEQCPSHPKCVEPEVERLLITKAKSLVSKYHDRSKQDQKTCDLIIFGPRRPSQQLMLALNVLNSRAPKQSQYQLTFTVFDNAEDMDIRFIQHSGASKSRGCFGIFTNQRSLENVSHTLKTFLVSISRDGADHIEGPPIVMLYAADITLDDRTMLALENEGQQIADSFKCPFMNVTAIDQYRQHQQNSIVSGESENSSQVMNECASLDYACVDGAFNVLKEAVSRRVCFMELYDNPDLIPRQAYNPDARILMCVLCGEPFSSEMFLWKMFLEYEDCYVTSSKSVCLKVKLGAGIERYIEVILASYTHGAFNYREDLLHGFVLVCSTQRKASVAILNAFSFNIPCTPVIVLAVKGNNEVQEDEETLSEAKAAASRLKGQFELIDISEDGQMMGEVYGVPRLRKFLQNVMSKKTAIERAYKLGDIPDDNNYPAKSVRERVDMAESRKNTFSSGDDEVEDQNNQIDQNFSEDDEADEEESRPTAVNHIRPLSHVKEVEQKLPQVSEAYATRPLPPIPSAIAPPHPRERKSTSDRKQLAPIPPPQLPPEVLKDISPPEMTKKASPPTEEDSESSSEIDADSEDMSDSKKPQQEKPKPGKLDLRQFDNITNAIGKLKVQPTGRAHDDPDRKTSIPNEEEPGFFKGKSKKTKSKSKDTAKGVLSKQSASPLAIPSPSSSNPVPAKRLANPRQNHGRAVAPPQLPKSDWSSNIMASNNQLTEEAMTRLTGDAPDFTQSPIAQRLLKHSKDYKVSELNSPSESDTELTAYSNRGQTSGLRGKYSNQETSSPFANSSIFDSSELINARGAAIRQLNEILANKQSPGRQGLLNHQASRSSSLDQDNEQDGPLKKNDKESKKEDKKKQRDLEKSERRRLKEEEKLRRQEKKLAKKSKSANVDTNGSTESDGVPLFVKRCIEFIEAEGLDAEGIYRVPGNRAHVDAFVLKFKENKDMSILESDIPVNAVATALKDFLSKKCSPIIPMDLMNELTENPNISEKERREAVRRMTHKLPPSNYKLLKYVFSHFVKVASNHSANSMDSKNLAICWWPTLLPLHFTDMVMFEQMRPHLEESIQLLIDEHETIFDLEET